MSAEKIAGNSIYPSVYDRLVAQTEETHRLFSAHWELTYRCNEQCSHCYLDVLPANAEAPGELTAEECFGVIDQLAELGVMNLLFSGGEILARRDFFDIARYARSKRILLRLYTNGILITPRVADHITALHPYSVEISLYSVNPEIHDKITGRERSWELTMRAFSLLRDRGVRTKMKVPLMRENFRELRELEKLAANVGAQFRYDTTITPKDNGGLAPLKHRLGHEELVWLFREVLDADAWASRKVSTDSRTCGIGLNSVAIDPYGNIFPCVQTRELAGNLREQSLKAIWQESLVWKNFARFTVSELPVCRKCELLNLCVRCHGLAQVEGGDLRGPAFANCREALARRQVLIEKGALSADFPIPEHLKTYAEECGAGGEREQIFFPDFIPAAALRVRSRDEFDRQVK